MKKLKWLYPGMDLKRWIFLVAIGIFLISSGVVILIDVEPINVLNQLSPGRSKLISTIIILTGLGCVSLGIKRMLQSVYEVVLPEQKTELVDLFYRQKYLKKGPKVVAIGGGTGLSTLLRGMKKYTNNITALVTVADDGGSSGFLREELDILPPGDIRNCLSALADTEPLMEDLFRYRFDEGAGLAGHSFGNLLIAAMTDITGDFEHAVKKSSEVLAVRGRVLPITLEDMSLRAKLKNGKIIEGESSITAANGEIERVFINPEDSTPLPEALEAIEKAEAVILGPGSLYTSLLPNLLVKEVTEAIKKTNALKIYVCNVMTQPGETDGYTASDHIQTIYNHVDDEVMDYVLVNNEEVNQELIEKYAEEGAQPVEVDRKRLQEQGVQLIEEPMINQSNLVRHNFEKLSKVIMDLILEEQMFTKN